jgi:hypothetical protein
MAWADTARKTTNAKRRLKPDATAVTIAKMNAAKSEWLNHPLWPNGLSKSGISEAKPASKSTAGSNVNIDASPTPTHKWAFLNMR